MGIEINLLCSHLFFTSNFCRELCFPWMLMIDVTLKVCLWKVSSCPCLPTGVERRIYIHKQLYVCGVVHVLKSRSASLCSLLSNWSSRCFIYKYDGMNGATLHPLSAAVTFGRVFGNNPCCRSSLHPIATYTYSNKQATRPTVSQL